MRNSAPTNCEYKPPHGFTAENNHVCKMIRQEIYSVYYDKNVNSAVTCKSGRVVLSHQTVYFGISKRLVYSILFSCPIHCTFYCVLSHWKVNH